MDRKLITDEGNAVCSQEISTKDPWMKQAKVITDLIYNEHAHFYGSLRMTTWTLFQTCIKSISDFDIKPQSQWKDF